MLRRALPTRALIPSVAGLILGLFATTPLLAQPKSHSHPHKHEVQVQVVALEQQWCQAQISGDVAAMDKLLSDDFLGITSVGEVVTKAQQLERMRSHELNLTRLDITDLKIKTIGQIAIVTSLATIQGTSGDRPLNGSFRYTHVFQRLPSGVWKITSFEATHIRQNPGPGQASNGPPKP